MKKYKALKNHICRFNDGEQKCKCFDKGYRKAIKDILNNLNSNYPAYNVSSICLDIYELLEVKKKESRKGKKLLKIDKNAFKKIKYQVSVKDK